MTFKPIPFSRELPEGLRTAIEQKTLVIFIGAGISRLMGGWSWDTLVEELVEKCRTVGRIDYRHADYLLSKFNEEKKYVELITRCYEMLSDLNVDYYYDVIKISCDIRAIDKRLIDVYNIFKRISEYYVTTNYDEYFDAFFSIDDVVYDLEDINNSNNLDKNKLYHIHGSILDHTSLVLNEYDYLERYENNDYKKFLMNIFENYNVLFLGYGLSEYAINTILLRASYKKDEKRHYVLNAYYSNQFDDYDYDVNNLGRKGVNIVPYIKDVNKYNEMYEVLKSWDNDLFEISFEVERI